MIIMKTFLTLLNSPKYLDGVLVMYESLKRTHTKYPLTVLVTGADKLTYEIELLRRIEASDKRFKLIIKDHLILPQQLNSYLESYGFEAWNNTFDKLLAFELDDFEKIVFLDSDMLIMQNIDSLFNSSDMSAVPDGYAPLDFETGNRSLNSGLMVVTPKVGRIQELSTVIDHLLHRKHGKPIGDQDLLQEYYSGWQFDSSRHLPLGYNFFFANTNADGLRSVKKGGGVCCPFCREQALA